MHPKKGYIHHLPFDLKEERCLDISLISPVLHDSFLPQRKKGLF